MNPEASVKSNVAENNTASFEETEVWFPYRINISKYSKESCKSVRKQLLLEVNCIQRTCLGAVIGNTFNHDQWIGDLDKV